MSARICLFLACVIVIANGQAPPYNGTCVQGSYPPDQSQKVSEYVVNLDLPPMQRWVEVGKAKKGEIAQVLTRAFIYFIEEFGGWAKELIKLLDEYGEQLDDRLPQPYRDEMKGLADAAGLELGTQLVSCAD